MLAAALAAGWWWIMAVQVTATRTPTTMADVYAEIREVLREAGVTIERPALLILTAQVALETAWGKACICNNVGNLKHENADGQNWCAFVTSEVWGGQSHTVTQDFRAYPTLREGVIGFVKLIRTRYPGAWLSAMAGDVTGYAKGLKARGYFTADEKSYADNLVSIRARLDTLLGPDTEPELPAASDIPVLDEDAGESAVEVAEEPPTGSDS